MKLRSPLGLLPLFFVFVVLLGTARGQVVINEIYYDPPDNTTPTEFVELYNTTNAAVDLSGWKFDSGIDYTFPANSTLPAHGYAVVTQDVAAFQTQFGFAAYGPFSGKLSNSGERLRLRNASNVTVNDLNYGAGFPWPTAARGQGSSMELINPALDNTLPGSWRSSGQAASPPPQQVFVPPISTTWHYRKGTSEASTPKDAWRRLGFVEDGTWIQGQTSVGYGDNDDNTELSDMEGAYSSLYLRRIFSIPAGQVPGSVVLRARVDDGCIVWINGTEAGRFHVPAGDLNYNSFATNHDADVSQFEEITIPNAASFLVEGNNVIAIHALNSSLGSSDFTIDAQLLSVVTVPTGATPGAVNTVFAAQTPPSVDLVAHTPAQPAAGQPVTITARVLSEGSGVGSVSLSYQIVDPGSYIRKSDAAYSTAWTSVPMADNGSGGDAVAGDSVYTATLPATLQVHRRLMRYRVTATDSAGRSVRVPYGDDESPNFAYFTYNGAPSWSGAFDPGITPVQNFPASLMQTLPTYQLIANGTDVANSQYVSSFDGSHMWGTMVYNNKVYDHVQFHNRGEVSTYKSGKNKWRIHFNTARDFEPIDNWGHPYPETWNDLTINACASPWVPMHREMGGVEEAVSFRFMELAGVTASKTHFFHFRVIDDAAETPVGSQYSGGDPAGASGGDLWGLYMAVESPDGSFLDSRGLPDGNTYKIESSLGDKKHQGATESSDTSDWDTFRANSTTTQTEAWWRANLDLASYYSFAASNRALGNVDLRTGFNHCYYHNPDGHWSVLPWDMDMMFIAKTHQPGYVLQNNCLNVATLLIEYKNRCRELLDLLLDDASVKGGQVGQLIDEYAQMVNPTGQSLTWVDLDAAMWNKNPRSSATHFGQFFVTPFTGSWKGGSWTRTLATPDHEGQMKFLTDYITNAFPTGQTWAVNNGNQLGYGYKYVESDSADTTIPGRPTATYTGPANFPLNDLRFASNAFSTPFAPSRSFAAIQWRIGEISAPGVPLFDATQPRIYEVTDIWRSGEIATVAGETRVPGAGLKVGHTYRVRLRHKDHTGRWSRWSSAVQFVAGAVAVGPYQQSLAITEIMYNPGPVTAAETAAGFTAQDFEYLALKNVGAVALDLSSVSFTVGITYTFPAGATLAPGAYTLVVKNVSAFNLRYGSGKPVSGAYTGSLDNSGENLTLSLGGSSVIRSFAYSDGSHPATGQTVDPWPTEPDGSGYSLVLINPNSLPDPSQAANWRASRLPNGSPGADDAVSYNSWSAGYPAAGALTANPDGDLYNNFMEYSMGLNPMQVTPPGVIYGATRIFSVNSVSAPYLTYTFRRQVGASDITYHVEFGSDLASWSENGLRVSSTLNGDGTATEVWRAGQAMGSTPQFVRLRVTQP